jgi:hypothetical protein
MSHNVPRQATLLSIGHRSRAKSSSPVKCKVQACFPGAGLTGKALYALRVSGQSAKRRVYDKDVSYLLRTQLDDGTWFVRSRAFGFQPYSESGFPHGVDQFISASATS